ncbi:MAG: sigma-70 family RNA polymerase sigma factor [Myxococcales bacterium]|nr:sigma-70 family RNA polymerase sigma factor [Myxococcales bacterium]
MAARSEPDSVEQRAEAELVAGLRRRDPAVFERLVRSSGAQLMKIARRYLQSPADAADVVQESFVAVFEGIDRFAGQAQLRTWMHRIVVNKALMRLRSQRRHGEVAIGDLLPRFLPDGHQEIETQPWRAGADVELLARHTQVQVRQAIDTLPEAYRTVLMLRDIEEIDSSEAALLLGISEGALRVRLHRARQALRGLLAPLFVESSEGASGQTSRATTGSTSDPEAASAPGRSTPWR